MAIDALARGVAGAAQVGLAKANEKIDRLEGKTTRILYTAKTDPTASEIGTFVNGLGYTSPYEGVAVVVASTYHVWHYYENDNIGWRDDGVDTITPFTNQLAGSILGSTDDGKIGANQDGTGSVNGWSDLPNRYVQIRDCPHVSIEERVYPEQPLVYGDQYRLSDGEPVPVNDLRTLPICFDEKANLVMFHYTDSNSDKNLVNDDYSGNRWNTLLGKGNSLTFNMMIHNTENLVFGGKNIINIGVQDSATFGYRNNVYANQAMTHGYKNDNYGGESIVVGNQNQLLGTITVHDDGDGASSNTKSCAVFGTKNVIQNGFKYSLVSGELNTVNTGCTHDIIIGSNNIIGKKNKWNNIFGDSNDIRNYTTDTTVFGYKNKVYGGVDGTPTQYIYVMGHDNNNKDSSGDPVGMVFLFGHNLNPGKSDCTVVGSWNAGDSSESNAFFSVGTGVEGSPRTTFMVEDGNTKLNGTLTIGSTVLTEAQLQALLAMIPE